MARDLQRTAPADPGLPAHAAERPTGSDGTRDGGPTPLAVVDVTDARRWDNLLAALPGAHPLQSWAWGEARRTLGEDVVRLLIADGPTTLALAQAAIKRLTPLGVRVAWVARGPVWGKRHDRWADAGHALRRALAGRGVRLLIVSPYLQDGGPRLGWPVPWEPAVQTYWLDLTRPLDELDERLHKEWRYGKNRFVRDGGSVEEEQGAGAIEALVDLQAGLRRRKGFEGYRGPDFMRAVWRAFEQWQSDRVAAHLFLAKVGARSAASALILRAGDTAHYVWGAFDYEFRSKRVNEGLQWAIVGRLQQMGVARYDLGGVDPARNPGVYEFKKRMGGELVRLPRPTWTPLLR